MSSSLLRRILKHHWLDLAATVAVWCFVISFFCHLNANLNNSAALFCIISALLTPFWIFVRLSPIVFKLTEPVRREEISLTCIPARQYLDSHFIKPIFITCAPFTAWLAIIVIVSIKSSYHIAPYNFPGNIPPDIYVDLVLIFTICPTSLLISCSGVMVLLRRLCRNHSSAEIFTLVYFYALSLLLSLAIGALNSAEGLLFAPIMALIIWLPYHRWKRACSAYYTFE